MNPKISLHHELVKNLPREIKKLFTIFSGEIRLVGGCVRDLILGKKIHDYDFATKFLPQEITKILEKNKIKAVPTGAKFGTITAVVNGKNFEITTLRKDLATDGRHCDPEFVDDYFLDAARRDFTINALYLDLQGSVTDYFGGISDLKNKKVKFIGDANLRIEEDFLRILRFFRFSCDYAETLDVEGLKACVLQKKNLKKLSRERIRQEFLKLISSEKKEKLVAILKVLKSEKIAEEIFTEEIDVEGFECLTHEVLDAELSRMTTVGELKLAALFLQKNSNLKIFFQEICATNSEKKYFQFMIQNHDLSDLKRLLIFEEKNLVRDFYLLNFVKNFDPKKIAVVKKNLNFIQNFSAPIFPLNGNDVTLLGFKGSAVGKAIKQAKIFWIEGDFKASKADLALLLSGLKKTR